MENIILLIARVFLSLMFLWSGVRKLQSWNSSLSLLSSNKIPYPKYVLMAATALQVMGGLSLMLGVLPRLGAGALIVYSALAAVKLHNFWGAQGQEKVIGIDQFLKDLAVIGGLFYVLLFGAGSFTL